MRALTSALFLFFLSIPGSTYAADWMYITSKSDFSVDLAADRDSVRRSGSEVKLWVKWTYREPVTDHPKGKPYQISLKHYGFNCLERTVTVLSYVNYEDLERKNRTEYASWPDEPRWSEVVPDTMNETVMEFACAAP